MTELLQKKIDNGREYRSMRMDIADAEDYMVVGYATTFDDPYHLYNTKDKEGKDIEVREVVSRSAFDETDMSDVIFQYDHEGRVFARLSNKTMELKADEHGLLVRAYLGGTEIGRNLYEEIKGGYTDKMSFGFTVAKDHMTFEGDSYVRSIDSIGKLYDVSAVSLPQNNNTEIVSARKHIDGVIDELETERARAEEEMRMLNERKENLLAKLKTLRKDETNGNQRNADARH